VEEEDEENERRNSSGGGEEEELDGEEELEEVGNCEVVVDNGSSGGGDGGEGGGGGGGFGGGESENMQYTVVTWNTQGVAGAGDAEDRGRGILDMITSLKSVINFDILLVQEFATNQTVREGEVEGWRFF
jgi:hypothetical protein